MIEVREDRLEVMEGRVEMMNIVVDIVCVVRGIEWEKRNDSKK